MSWVRPAIGAGAALVGIGLATRTFGAGHDFAAKHGEQYWNRQLDGTDRSATDYYGGSALIECMGGLGLAAGGVAALTKVHGPLGMVLGGAALVGAGALFGFGAGGFSGFSAGKDAAFESHGTNIETQADRLITNFDHDGDGALSTTNSAEYLYKYDVDYHRKDYPNETKWASIEKFVKAADANRDGTTDRQEIVDKMKSYDGNHNGLLSYDDGQRLKNDGLEHVAVEEVIAEHDPWGMGIPVKW